MLNNIFLFVAFHNEGQKLEMNEIRSKVEHWTSPSFYKSLYILNYWFEKASSSVIVVVFVFLWSLALFLLFLFFNNLLFSILLPWLFSRRLMVKDIFSDVSLCLSWLSVWFGKGVEMRDSLNEAGDLQKV